jgi:hypothetical protein
MNTHLDCPQEEQIKLHPATRWAFGHFVGRWQSHHTLCVCVCVCVFVCVRWLHGTNPRVYTICYTFNCQVGGIHISHQSKWDNIIKCKVQRHQKKSCHVRDSNPTQLQCAWYIYGTENWQRKAITTTKLRRVVRVMSKALFLAPTLWGFLASQPLCITGDLSINVICQGALEAN